MSSSSARSVQDSKGELLALTDEEDDWKVPVAITLHGKSGDPLPPRTIAMQLLIVAGVKELKIDKHLGNGLEEERLKRAVTGALLYERALKAGVGDSPMRISPWLLEGLREATAWRLNESDRRLYATLFKQGGLFKIDELFALDEKGFDTMDGATRPAFRVSSGALVMALLEQPQGKEGFRAFLTEVAHAYTHFRITLHAFHAAYTGGEPQHLGVMDHAWVTLADLDGYAFAVTDRKIIAALRAALGVD